MSRHRPEKVRFWRGRSYLDLGLYSDAIRNYDDAIRLGPNDVNRLIIRAVALSQAGRLDEALADFDRAIREQPDNAILLANRGEVYHDLERYEDATKDFDLAIGIDPDNPDFLLARVRSLLVRRVADQSIRDCTKVIRTDPGHALAYMLRREAHLLRGDPEAAEADRRAAAAIDPEGVEAWDDGDESE